MTLQLRYSAGDAHCVSLAFMLMEHQTLIAYCVTLEHLFIDRIAFIVELVFAL